MKWIIKITEELGVGKITTYNTIDMFYRIHNIIPNNSVSIKLDVIRFMCTCLTLSAKIYKNEFDPLKIILPKGIIFTKDQLFATERLIVEHLGGVLDIDLPIFYDVDFTKYKKWIVVNLEKYEQFNMAGLVREINA